MSIKSFAAAGPGGMADPREAGASALAQRANGYVLTLQGMRYPIAGHIIFNAFSCFCIGLIERWSVAVLALVISSTADVIAQLIIRRLAVTAEEADEQRGCSTLAWISASRAAAYLAVPVWLVVDGGGVAELGYLSTIVGTLIVLGISKGSFSARVLLGFALPALVAGVIAPIALMPPAAAAGVLGSMLGLGLTVATVSRITRKSVQDWRATFNAHAAMIPELERARDAAQREELATKRALAQLEEALQRTVQSEQRLQLALKLANVHVWEIDYRHGAAEGVDDKTLPPLKPGVSQLHPGVDMWGALHPADRARAQASWKRHLEKGAPHHLKHRVMTKDGPPVWVEAACEAIRDAEGQVERVVGATRNVDKETRAAEVLAKARDEAEAANRAKSLFVATMSHEIRTPLNGVLGMAQAMALDELQPQQRARLEVIRHSSEALLAILNDILDLSKIEAGKLVLEEVDFDIEDLAAAIRAAFSAMAEEKQLEFDLQVSARAKGVYKGDPTRLRQILFNLVSNAIKFTQTGSVRVTIAAAAEGLTIRVADTGVGISRDACKRLFQKFEQADASTTRKFGGTGLGLAICRELVELMGGAISVCSRLGEGAVFTVKAPLARSDATLAPVNLAPPAAGPSLGQLRVLAAEDNGVNQLVLKTLLGTAGVRPTIVENSREALDAWAEGEWDLVLLDVQMPVMDGPSAAREIRRRELAEGRPRTPILALTANSMAHQIEDYFAVGMDGVVPKPIETHRLFEAIDAALSGGAEPVAAA